MRWRRGGDADGDRHPALSARELLSLMIDSELGLRKTWRLKTGPSLRSG
jgi:hypothetical protein